MLIQSSFQHLLKHYPRNVPQNYFDSVCFDLQPEQEYKFQNVCFPQVSPKTDSKFLEIVGVKL